MISIIKEDIQKLKAILTDCEYLLELQKKASSLAGKLIDSNPNNNYRSRLLKNRLSIQRENALLNTMLDSIRIIAKITKHKITIVENHNAPMTKELASLKQIERELKETFDINCQY